MSVPWQFAERKAIGMLLGFAALMVLAVASGYLGWRPSVTGTALLVGYFVLMNGVSIFLSLSRTYSVLAFGLFAVLVAATIIAFALHYRSSGLLVGGHEFVPDFLDAVYFSVTTFTTLGYGDFQPLSGHRLTTSIEALLGMLFMATLVSYIWLRFSETLIPRGATFSIRAPMDNTSPILKRMRVRALTGVALKAHRHADFREGVPHYYDEDYKDWTPVSDREALPDETVVIARKGRKFAEGAPGKRNPLKKIMSSPVQTTEERGILLLLGFVVSASLAVVSGHHDWHPFITGASLVVGYFALMGGVSIFLGLDHTHSGLALGSVVVLVALTIIAFALHYVSSGLLVGGRHLTPDFFDAIYFSVTTFTTLGYGDFQPLSGHRLTTSTEALLGMLFMAGLVSFIWFRFSENLIPKDMTFLEGMRIGNPEPALVRVRTRTFTGKRLGTKKYEDFVEGVPHHYDKGHKDWVPVSVHETLQDDTIVITRREREFGWHVPGKGTLRMKILGLARRFLTRVPVETPPQQIGFLPLKQLIKELRKFRSELMAHENRTSEEPGWKISRCISSMEAIIALDEAEGLDAKEEAEEHFAQNIEEICFGYQEGNMIYCVYKHSPKKRLFADTSIFIEGSPPTMDEDGEKETASTNKLFEEFTKVLLKKAGCEILDRETGDTKRIDILFEFRGQKFAAECRRPKKEQRIKERARDAREQLAEFCKGRKKGEYQPVIVLDWSLPICRLVREIINETRPHLEFTEDRIWERLIPVFNKEVWDVPENHPFHFVGVALVPYFESRDRPTISVQLLAAEASTGAPGSPFDLLGTAIGKMGTLYDE